jgi:ElaB/YqjD/DUF883 family membrane-anchored ribosome-binding protein
MNGGSQVRTAKAAASDAAQRIADVAADVADAAADAGTRARTLAQDAGRRANAAAETVYGTGSEVADLVEDVVRQNPWASLFVAMAAGYGLACIVKQQPR